MSAIICFDIRNFTTHVSHHSSQDKGEIFKVIEDIFKSLEKAIKKSRTMIGIARETFVNHTGDGFVAIFYGKGRCLQSLLVAFLIADDVNKILDIYNNNANNELKNISPLDYGIGIHLGKVIKFKYQSEYPENHYTVGLLGHAINLSNRVQESTKDHTFQVICTNRIYKEAISVVKSDYRKNIDGYFIPLGKHKLRGIKKSETLYGVKIDFAMKIEPNMIQN